MSNLRSSSLKNHTFSLQPRQNRGEIIYEFFSFFILWEKKRFGNLYGGYYLLIMLSQNDFHIMSVTKFLFSKANCLTIEWNLYEPDLSL